MKRVYLDYAATTPTDPEVVRAMLPYYTDLFGNPSSIHRYGQESKGAVEEAREKIAALLGSSCDEIVFTSGGTESNNFAIEGVSYANRHRGNHIITTAIEHPAVIEPCRFLKKSGFDVSYLPVDRYGMVDPVEVKRAITDKTILISVMHANNEIGTIEPIDEIGRIARKRDIYFHTDAVQSFGHLYINVDELNIDLLSASAHKLYGPKGVGMLYIRKGTKIAPLLHGGEQEHRRRASTENVPAIVGFGKAAEIARERMDDEAKTLTFLRDKLIKGILNKIENVSLNGHPQNRLHNNINITIERVEGESMILNLDLEGIAASTGSACSSLTLEPSHVLKAIGISHERAHSSLRFTTGRYTDEEDIEHLLDILPNIVTRLRSL